MTKMFVYEIGDIITCEESPMYTHGGAWLDVHLLDGDQLDIYYKYRSVNVHRNITPGVYRTLKDAIMETFRKEGEALNRVS